MTQPWHDSTYSTPILLAESLEAMADTHADPVDAAKLRAAAVYLREYTIVTRTASR